ncbi:unnamed protein product [Trichogramma brassicae]|uniref:Uncharacterized protein n=1 Tax=Trichogramma brassicae TaxID=86971 RepID=A0A6H5IYJ5_9HYME|nr:unnamed protein product [Trichogramma brassicae]
MENIGYWPIYGRGSRSAAHRPYTVSICDEINQPVDVDGLYGSQQTPLHLALVDDNRQVVLTLLRRGANPNLANKDGLTALHLICQSNCDDDFVETFFEICDEKHRALQVNAQDNLGNTPLHLALKNRFYAVRAELLLRRGADPNLVNEEELTPLQVICEISDNYEFLQRFFNVIDEVHQTIDIHVLNKLGQTPLHLALDHENMKVAEMLLQRGVNPNSADNNGMTPLHYICTRGKSSNIFYLFFEINDANNRTVNIDARNKWGYTPLHLALTHGREMMAAFLLNRGANLSLVANKDGLTPLHVICRGGNDDESVHFLKIFFEINDEKNQLVQIEVRDNLGRTPLQLAIENLMPNVIDLLLDRGADLSAVRFPDESHFVKMYETENNGKWFDFKLGLESGILAVVDCLERRGYKLDRNLALTIMKTFANCEKFHQSKHSGMLNRDEFMSAADMSIVKQIWSLYDLMCMRPEQAKKLFTYKNYVKIARKQHLRELLKEADLFYTTHLCEITSRGFYRRWALEFFSELTGYQLPILCCEKIIDLLKNKDLLGICLAAEVVAKEESKNIEEIEHLLSDAMQFWGEGRDFERELVIEFVARGGYRHQPELDQDGEPLLRRTTAIHHAARQKHYAHVRKLFDRIYDGLDLNYVDEWGFTHFHAVCMSGCRDLAERFLELGQDPNFLVPETGESPLQLALIRRHGRVMESLLRRGADPNSTGNYGLTALHIICMRDDDDDESAMIFETFFKVNDELNRMVQVDARDKFGRTSLHVALTRHHRRLFESLLRRGADPNIPNLADKDGSTVLHLLCKGRDDDVDWLKILFEISNEQHRLVQVDARDNLGNTALHYAVSSHDKKRIVHVLLENLNPNATDVDGLTPLLRICQRKYDDDLVQLLFKICDEKHQLVEVDIQDELGRTSLQWAVANVLPDVVNTLLDRGADVSSFVFPTEGYFAEGLTPGFDDWIHTFKLRLGSGVLIIVEHLEKRGYELNRSDALTIMKFFAKYGLLQKWTEIDYNLYEYGLFENARKSLMILPDLSFHDLIWIRLEDAEKLLTYTDYFKFSRTHHHWYLPAELSPVCAVHLCEKLSRGFFRRWALYPFWELIHYRVPIECCEMIIEDLMNEDLYNICLAAGGQSSVVFVFTAFKRGVFFFSALHEVCFFSQRFNENKTPAGPIPTSDVVKSNDKTPESPKKEDLPVTLPLGRSLYDTGRRYGEEEEAPFIRIRHEKAYSKSQTRKKLKLQSSCVYGVQRKQNAFRARMRRAMAALGAPRGGADRHPLVDRRRRRQVALADAPRRAAGLNEDDVMSVLEAGAHRHRHHDHHHHHHRNQTSSSSRRSSTSASERTENFTLSELIEAVGAATGPGRSTITTYEQLAAGRGPVDLKSTHTNPYYATRRRRASQIAPTPIHARVYVYLLERKFFKRPRLGSASILIDPEIFLRGADRSRGQEIPGPRAGLRARSRPGQPAMQTPVRHLSARAQQVHAVGAQNVRRHGEDAVRPAERQRESARRLRRVRRGRGPRGDTRPVLPGLSAPRRRRVQARSAPAAQAPPLALRLSQQHVRPGTPSASLRHDQLGGVRPRGLLGLRRRGQSAPPAGPPPGAHRPQDPGQGRAGDVPDAQGRAPAHRDDSSRPTVPGCRPHLRLRRPVRALRARQRPPGPLRLLAQAQRAQALLAGASAGRHRHPPRHPGPQRLHAHPGAQESRAVLQSVHESHRHDRVRGQTLDGDRPCGESLHGSVHHAVGSADGLLVFGQIESHGKAGHQKRVRESTVQDSADPGGAGAVLHVRDAVHRLGAAVEPRGDPTRRHLQEDLVAQLPLHSQLLRFREHGKHILEYNIRYIT